MRRAIEQGQSAGVGVNTNSRERQKRLFAVGSTAIVVATVMGLISGTRPPALPEAPSREESGPVRYEDQNIAPSYAELREGRRGKNAEMYVQAFESLRRAGPDIMDPVEQSAEDRQRALAERAARRAYAGAPPVVPHAVQERAPGACLTCHGEGARIGEQRAPAMSHELYAACVQCHAVERREPPPALQEPSVAVGSEFQGMREAGRGEVAWEGAPPVIPHSTLMRENCDSCHGRLGTHGIRTPHPYQQSCQQCHAATNVFNRGGPPTLD